MKKNKIFFKNLKVLPVDSFFKNVLYDKKFGYYNSRIPFGKKGDFITSIKVSSLFSEIIAIWIISCWETFGKPKNFNIVELGPGDGSLTKILLRSFRKFPKLSNTFCGISKDFPEMFGNFYFSQKRLEISIIS